MQVSNFGGALTKFSFQFFMKFLQKMPLNVFYTMVQKSQTWPKTQIKGGPALSPFNLYNVEGGALFVLPPRKAVFGNNNDTIVRHCVLLDEAHKQLD